MFSPRVPILLMLFLAPGCAFITLTVRHYRNHPAAILFVNKDGYRFGDFTKSVLGTTAKIVTGKDNNYQFGDITKGIVGTATNAVKQISGKEDYQFGDLTLSLDRKAKAMAADFTGMSDYQVGDVSKEILRRVYAKEYKVEDIFLLVKIMLLLGAEFSPLASVLPAKLLLEMLNYSLAQEVSGKILEIVAGTLDTRFKEAITGDPDYVLGDLTKKAILKFIGKKEGDYEFGDMSRTLLTRLKEKNESEAGVVIDSELVNELEHWDIALRLHDS